MYQQMQKKKKKAKTTEGLKKAFPIAMLASTGPCDLAGSPRAVELILPSHYVVSCLGCMFVWAGGFVLFLSGV